MVVAANNDGNAQGTWEETRTNGGKIFIRNVPYQNEIKSVMKIPQALTSHSFIFRKKVNLWPRSIPHLWPIDKPLAWDPLDMPVEISVMPTIWFVSFSSRMIHATSQRIVITTPPCLPFSIQIGPKNIVVWSIGIPNRKWRSPLQPASFRRHISPVIRLPSKIKITHHCDPRLVIIPKIIPIPGSI